MRKGGNEKMKNKFVLIRYVLMLWMLCGVCHTQSVASAATYTPQAASSWGYKPLHSVSASQVHVVGCGGGAGGGIAGNGGSAYRASYSPASASVAMPSMPSYNFQTTSAYRTNAGASAQPVILAENAAYSSPFDPDEDDPIGTVTPQPVGDAPWLLLLLLVAGYVLFPPMRRSMTSSTARN